MNTPKQTTTHFGYETVTPTEKTEKVAGVFHSVASRYDMMNDLMSLGLHRLWKRFAVNSCQLHAGDHVLDLAGGTGDLTRIISPRVGKQGSVTLCDINSSMLNRGRDRLLDQGLYSNLHFVQANAEHLPFPEDTFHCVIIGFGLRNVTDKLQALKSMYRVLKPGGRLIILEFSKPQNPLVDALYDIYSFKILPPLGEWVANDGASYQYLAESIRMHPDQNELCKLMQAAAFEDCRFNNLLNGIVAIHRGYKY